MASEDKRIVAVTAAMRDGTGLKEFAEKFPDRFFDVGIAEQHALGLIAGMARAGLKKNMFTFLKKEMQICEILGGKGANLAEMTNLGLPIPQGFTVTTEACTNIMKMEKNK